MTDKIDELKRLLETLVKDSSLRESLEEALKSGLKHIAEEEARATADEAPQGQTSENEDDGDADDAEETCGDHSTEILDGITEKLDELLQDDEFITASAGFLLGAVSVGLGALAVSALKK